MPTSMIAAISNVVATGRRMKMREGLISKSRVYPHPPSAHPSPPPLAGEGMEGGWFRGLGWARLASSARRSPAAPGAVSLLLVFWVERTPRGRGGRVGLRTDPHLGAV